mmetsp:Transcript_12432/g.20365  ORF Transcript_12432/g.20365 Transcript_12432/m.20365 type:complete len:141 (+) Transcript_12432:80-502(+)|eukprot:CAMPEP_0169109270 /NCGR_PEP_ID=MMETSP1015-20121227/25876_1 /TAXON_ID=342587 /ORGANISM="Karlodinium micrum, Strain CCMP2283" /LENGTH=140 /DNA_ID=CAMNT_0009170957 /DNA_START=74 /DNA_END=496 /DNA_ORIENTATION=-
MLGNLAGIHLAKLLLMCLTISLSEASERISASNGGPGISDAGVCTVNGDSPHATGNEMIAMLQDCINVLVQLGQDTQAGWEESKHHNDEYSSHLVAVAKFLQGLNKKKDKVLHTFMLDNDDAYQKFNDKVDDMERRINNM